MAFNPLSKRQNYLINKHRRRRSRRSNRHWSIKHGGFWEWGVNSAIYGYGKWAQVKKHGCRLE